jgi:hypothetical protein
MQNTRLAPLWLLMAVPAAHVGFLNEEVVFRGFLFAQFGLALGTALAAVWPQQSALAMHGRVDITESFSL